MSLFPPCPKCGGKLEIVADMLHCRQCAYKDPALHLKRIVVPVQQTDGRIKKLLIPVTDDFYHYLTEMALLNEKELNYNPTADNYFTYRLIQLADKLSEAGPKSEMRKLLDSIDEE